MPKVSFSLETLEHLDDFENKPNPNAGAVVSQGMNRKRPGSDKNAHLETLPEDMAMQAGDAVSSKETKADLVQQNTLYESADVVTFVSNMNVCFGIFKNPSDHKTHFYSRRIKGSGDKNVSLELKNVAASVRIWGKQWDGIHNIKFSLKNSDAFLDNSKERHLLENQFEDCQNRFGCKITLQDFKSLSAQDRNVFSDLLDKIQNCCVSDDDTQYFRLHDDSGLLNSSSFDL